MAKELKIKFKKWFGISDIDEESEINYVLGSNNTAQFCITMHSDVCREEIISSLLKPDEYGSMTFEQSSNIIEEIEFDENTGHSTIHCRMTRINIEEYEIKPANDALTVRGNCLLFPSKSDNPIYLGGIKVLTPEELYNLTGCTRFDDIVDMVRDVVGKTVPVYLGKKSRGDRDRRHWLIGFLDIEFSEELDQNNVRVIQRIYGLTKLKTDHIRKYEDMCEQIPLLYNIYSGRHVVDPDTIRVIPVE